MVLAFNRLSRKLAYDPLGRLYKVEKYTGNDALTGTTNFLYDGQDLIAEYDGNGAMLNRYVHGTGSGDDALVAYEGNATGSTYQRYLYGDRLGSIFLSTKRDGSAPKIASYNEYGLPGSANQGIGAGGEGRFQYTGQMWLPEIGMYHYKARAYSPNLGRFMQTDPIGYGDGLNMYAYTHNDPVNGVDPTGLDIVVVGPKCSRGVLGGDEITGYFCFRAGPGGRIDRSPLRNTAIKANPAIGGSAPQSDLLQDICHLAEGVESVGDAGVDAGLLVAVGGAIVTANPAGATPGLTFAGISGDVSAGSQLVADLTQAQGLGDVAQSGGRAAINALGGRVVTRALRGVRIGPYLDKAGQTGLNGAIGEAASYVSGAIAWLDPHYGC